MQIKYARRTFNVNKRTSLAAHNQRGNESSSGNKKNLPKKRYLYAFKRLLFTFFKQHNMLCFTSLPRGVSHNLK